MLGGWVLAWSQLVGVLAAMMHTWLPPACSARMPICCLVLTTTPARGAETSHYRSHVLAQYPSISQPSENRCAAPWLDLSPIAHIRLMHPAAPGFNPVRTSGSHAR